LHCHAFSSLCLKVSFTHRSHRDWRGWVQFQLWRFII
jgi:hypothetical protein